VINEVMYKPSDGNEEWVELYNSGTASENIDGWQITDEDGTTGNNEYVILDIPVFPSHNYVVIHYTTGTDETSFGQSQANALHLYTGDDTDVFDDAGDQCSLYTGNTHSSDTIADFVAWDDDDGSLSEDQQSDDNNAVDAGIWDAGDYVDTSGVSEGNSIGRDSSSTDTNAITDWSENGDAGSPTPGQQNIPEFSTLLIPIIGTIALFAVFRKLKIKGKK
jgi:hypothetical protein